VQKAVLVKIAAPGDCGKKRFGRIQKKVSIAARTRQSRPRAVHSARAGEKKDAERSARKERRRVS